MRISWFEDAKWQTGAEYFCAHVDRDLNECSAYIRVIGNSMQADQSARNEGWSVIFGEARCPEHLPDAQKTIRKAK